jgi:hypothetical protein
VWFVERLRTFVRSRLLSYQINALKPTIILGQRLSPYREGEQAMPSSVPTYPL